VSETWPCATGSAKLTSGYLLPARYVIHAVGPAWDGGDRGEDELLVSCHRASIRLAVEHGCSEIAFPAISCGAYRFPASRAAEIAIGTVSDELKGQIVVKRVVFAVRDTKVEGAFRASLARLQTQSG
jgi:O-acetyl-ADP-ribose deacetylase (regulator of RNase III)